MQKSIISLAMASLLAVPSQAAAQSHIADIRTGAFVGARFQLKLGGKSASRPRPMLAIAPTTTGIGGKGELRTTIGEGVALNFTDAKKPQLTIVGLPARQALHLAAQGDVDAERKLGLSTGAWIGIGVVAAAAVGLAIVYHEAKENSD